ncbi:MAG: nucleoside permease, partial [Bacteroidales bacterium]|nr:nucleoside permease [Bacteroidales bacterium]
FGTMIGSLTSGIIIKKFFIMENGNKDWHDIWLTFAIYALVVAILFAILFKHKHNANDTKLQNISH